MTKRMALGRGLGALIQGAGEKEGYTHCLTEDIIPGKFQPRRHFDTIKLSELADSIKEKGILEPLLVKRRNNSYELVAGERRWRAAKVAGLRKVPVIVMDIADEEMLELAIVENIQREDLNALEEAEAYRNLQETFSLSQEEVAKRIGKDRATVANYLRLLKLSYEVKEELLKGTISMGHARALLSLEDHVQQREVLKKIVGKGMSVRETELLVKRDKKITHHTKKPTNIAAYLALESELRSLFGTKVAIKGKKGKGKIEIEFYSDDELDRLLDILRSI